jgi:hypothetical protein
MLVTASAQGLSPCTSGHAVNVATRFPPCYQIVASFKIADMGDVMGAPLQSKAALLESKSKAPMIYPDSMIALQITDI